MSAAMPASFGDAMLVPPMRCQLPPDRKISPTPELAARSGTCRQAGEQFDAFALGCHDGLPNRPDSPPPPAPPPKSAQPVPTAPAQVFHTGSWLGFVTARFRFNEVPPTPVTSGSFAGESTVRSNEPSAA